MSKKLLLVIILLISSLISFSQDLSQDSIVPKTPSRPLAKSIDSTFVTYNAMQFDSLYLNASKVIDTLTFHASDHEILEREHTVYSTLSNTGLAHKSMRFRYLVHSGFDMTLPSFAAYMQNEANMVAYQSVLPYSELRYVMTTGDKEQHLNVKFGRQFTPQLFITFAFNTDFSPGAFTNCKSINNYFWVNAHYFTKNKRYGATAYYYRNKLDMQENGGIVNDESYSSHTESDNSVIPVNLTTASNFVVSNGIGFEHYFNLLSQKTKVTPTLPEIDSIAVDTLLINSDTLRINDSPTTVAPPSEVPVTTKDRKFTLGRICHEFSILNNKLYYNEASASVSFYRPYDTLLNDAKSTDSTIVRAIRNTLEWNSLGYQKYNDDVPLYIYAGITHGLYNIRQYDYTERETVLANSYNQVSLKGGIIVNLFKSTRITGKAEFVTLGYQIGDFDIKGQWRQFLGTSAKNFGQATLDFDLKRQSANWFETSYYSNHFRWENDFRAATYLSFNLKYNYKTYCIGVKQTTISNLIYFGTDARPAQFDGIFSIREAYLSFYQKLWRFEFEGFACLQKSSNEDVMHLPLFMGQLKIGYSQPIFHKAATLHPSITVRYFTKYYADAYMPATRTFYLQNEVQIGNFPYIDLAISLKVKKAHIYVAYSNMFLLTGNYNSFIAPHYPMRDSKFFFGVNWRLFN